MKKWTLLWKNWPKSSAWAYRLLLFVCGLGCSQFSVAQFVQRHHIDAKSGQVALKSDLKITAVAVVVEEASSTGHSILIDGARYELELDVHAPKPTYFISLPESANTITVTQTLSEAEVYTIHSGPAPSIELLRSATDCAEINAIPQSDWRTGLPAPAASPSFHTVTHHIVHHTAGSNSNTDYVQAVRDIYLLHTEINGWNDIGYNFVIAQDGTLFEGRDPGTSRTEFEVRGAHFCGKNTGTFGVALLGNYETAQPTTATRETLVDLLTFSLSELEIHPISSSNHRGADLQAISGHRDGCATLCPGANVYTILPEIRAEVLRSLDNCTEILELSFTSTQEIKAGEGVAFENTSFGYDSFTWKFSGGSPETTDVEHPVIFYQESGLYDVTLFGHIGNLTDSLVLANYIRVGEQNPEPLVFPNPVRRGDGLDIDFFDDLTQVSLYELSGKKIAQYGAGEFSSLQAPDRAGFYTMMIETAHEKFTQKLIVR